MPAASKLNGLQKTAILLITLGADISGSILKSYFHNDDIEKITQQIAMMDSVPRDVQEEVLMEFSEMLQAREFLMIGGMDYAKEMLRKALGDQKAKSILEKVQLTIKNKPFSALRKTDPRHLVTFIRDEHPQVIALILNYLSPDQAALILSALNPEQQSDIARRVALTDRVSPEMIREVEGILERKLSVLEHSEQTTGGVKALVDVLNRVDRSTEKTILEELEITDPALTEEVRKLLFVFEDIVKLPDSSIQRVLREVDPKDLAKAMRGTNEDVQERIFKNMSKRASDMLRDEIRYMGPIRLRDVEDSQQKIVQIIRRLDEAGEIVIARGGEDAVIS
ncbi:flagellar motor switch protein FliG [Desulfotomaculum arcticum]|uniref:Flagellar motor switch protein FliG n=1 Tax=Desulfotruncus arcticus DSM 17038 TaxID=1121424 RepID=A0A1I2MYX5_9FIRM|nr:flagellar motor switch protein FliG [Desulfotruncus arcticus]SFF95839.1 flagellar motor switch protein FliG [Desulfotomaculum arcticum] [Desulfotruncus arcticus DSM 17038]